MNEEIIDILHRNVSVSSIMEVVETMKKCPNNGFILINGEWGSGKTTLLKLLKEKIKNDNNVIEYNCWENSFYPDPLIAIISSITDQTDKNSDINKLGIRLMRYFKPSISSFSIKGFEIKWKRKQQNEEYISLEKYIADFRKKLNDYNKNNVGKDNKKTRIILVDELDRCLPEYAIKVLERLYLLFKGVNNVILIIAADTKQLEHSIQTIFGMDFKLDKYLKKFVDFNFELNYGVVDQSNVYEKFKEYFKMFKMSDYNYVTGLVSPFTVLTPIRDTVKKVENIILLHNTCLSKYNEKYICIFEMLLVLIDEQLFNKIFKIVYSLLNDTNYNPSYENEIQKEICKNIYQLSNQFYRPSYELNDIKKGYQLYFQYLYCKNIIDNNLFNKMIEDFFNNYIVNIKSENMEIINSIHEYLIQKNKG